jgi:hypothetical protein
MDKSIIISSSTMHQGTQPKWKMGVLPQNFVYMKAIWCVLEPSRHQFLSFSDWRIFLNKILNVLCTIRQIMKYSHQWSKIFILFGLPGEIPWFFPDIFLLNKFPNFFLQGIFCIVFPDSWVPWLHAGIVNHIFENWKLNSNILSWISGMQCWSSCYGV